MGRTSEFF
jgi:hypothetical protein